MNTTTPDRFIVRYDDGDWYVRDDQRGIDYLGPYATLDHAAGIAAGFNAEARKADEMGALR